MKEVFRLFWIDYLQPQSMKQKKISLLPCIVKSIIEKKMKERKIERKK